MMKTITQPCKP